MARFFGKKPRLKLRISCPACGTFSSLSSDTMLYFTNQQDGALHAVHNLSGGTSRNVLTGTGTVNRQSERGIKDHFLSLSSLHGLAALCRSCQSSFQCYIRDRRAKDSMTERYGTVERTPTCWYGFWRLEPLFDGSYRHWKCLWLSSVHFGQIWKKRT